MVKCLLDAQVLLSCGTLMVLEKCTVCDVKLCRRQNICDVHLPISEYQQIHVGIKSFLLTETIFFEPLHGVNTFCTLQRILFLTADFSNATNHLSIPQTIGYWSVHRILQYYIFNFGQVSKFNRWIRTATPLSETKLNQNFL